MLADIHANHLALEAVLNVASKSCVELLAGDCVGYYFEPLQVIKMLQSWKHFAVKGNHEDMLCRAREDVDFQKKVTQRYGSGIKETIKQLSNVQLDGLCELPHPLELELDRRKVLLCHGAPQDLDCYLYPDSELEELDIDALAKYDLVVTGHTHYPMQKVLNNNILLVNPGSVGQPRNRQPGAHWALYDTTSGYVSFHCESYNYTKLQIEAKNRHPELPYLGDVLGRT